MPPRSGLAYPIALLVEALLFYRHVLFYPGYVFPWDFRAVHVPLATLIADSFRHGEFPLWDPYTYCGNPIFANIQAALFYPPVLAATTLAAFLGDDAIPRLLAIMVVAQVFVAGLSAYALARRLGARPAPAWIAGTVFELGCFFAAQAEHMGVMQAAAWLPLCWLAVLNLHDGLKWRWLCILSLTFSMTVLAGSPPCALAVIGSTLAFAVLLPAFRMASWTLPLRVMFAASWALALAAIQIVPTIQLTRNSVAKYRAEWLKTGGGMNPGALFSMLVPNYWSVFDLSKFHGPTDLTFLYLYSSVLGLVLAVAAMLWKPKGPARVFTVLTIVILIAMLGDNTWIGRVVLAALPVDIRIATHPEYAFCGFSLAIAVLAGLGADRFLKNARLQVIAGIVIACDLILVSSGRPMNAMALKIEPGFTRASFDGSRQLASRLQTLAWATNPPSRVDMMPGMPFTWSSMGPVMAIPTANGCDPLAPERVIQVRLSFSTGARWGTCLQVINPQSPVLSLVNDRYLLSVNVVNSPGLKLVDTIGGYRIYENTSVLPRFFLVNRLRHVATLEQGAALLHAADFDPSQVAIIEASTPPASAEGNGRIDVLSYRPSNVALEVHAQGQAFLVAADAWYPGWRAYIDGKPAPLYIVDVAFRGISVPPGDHRVEMLFRPRILYLSAGISALAFLVLLAIFKRRA